MHGLPLGEVYTGDLSLDLAANDVCVIGNDSADAVQINRHVVLIDHSGDDRDGRWRRGCRGLFGCQSAGEGETAAACGENDQNSRRDNDFSPHWCSPKLLISSQSKTLKTRLIRFARTVRQFPPPARMYWAP